ncbi:MAG TPA: winged helix-turn-helix domain-containing protein [Acetobacteraceae bacterium]|nr:winged helix-turn-helix domain-containing protein [Acetobacteraceae bacterium]
MLTTTALAETAFLIGDPARASILMALLDGRALTATELARAAGITPQTASGHLQRLVEAGLLDMARQGRHRYHRLASPAVAQMLEAIMSVSINRQTCRKAAVVGPRDKALRRARTCYDHLAGEVAVAITDRLIERGQIELSLDGGAVTEEGDRLLRRLGVDLDGSTVRAKRSGRLFCRPCLDWSERRPHLGGAVGAALCKACLEQGWIRRLEGTRAVTITLSGQAAFKREFDVRLEP